MSEPVIAELRFATVPLGCVGIFGVPLTSWMLYLAVNHEELPPSGLRNAHLFKSLVQDTVMFGISLGAALATLAFGLMAFAMFRRVMDPVAAVAGPRGIGVHPAILRGRIDWDQIESISIVPMRSSGLQLGKRLEIRLHQGRGFWRRPLVRVEPVDVDDGADERFMVYVARYLPAVSINRYLSPF